MAEAEEEAQEEEEEEEEEVMLGLLSLFFHVGCMAALLSLPLQHYLCTYVVTHIT